MASDVEVQNSATPVLDHKQAIQELEGQRGHSEEIEADDCLAMIGEEREPAFGGITPARLQAAEISGDSAFGDLEAQLQYFPMDPGRSPVCADVRATRCSIFSRWTIARASLGSSTVPGTGPSQFPAADLCRLARLQR